MKFSAIKIVFLFFLISSLAYALFTDGTFDDSANNFNSIIDSEKSSVIQSQTTSSIIQTNTTINISNGRMMERLDRGVIALKTSTGVFISWRLLGLDPDEIAFNIYRSSDGGQEIKLNSAPITESTNYIDLTASNDVTNIYSIRPILNNIEQPTEGAFTLTANHAQEPIIRVPLGDLPNEGYKTRYVWVGDLDGDGQYEFVLDRIAPGDPNNLNYSLGNQFVDAYKMDGTHLWRVDMGPNSRYTYRMNPGSATLSVGMLDGVTVYDLDGDGKAEVVLKVANGVKFADGKTFTADNDDDQYIAILKGTTGELLTSTQVPQNLKAQGRLATQFGIGYINGHTPSIIFWGRNRNKDLSFNDVFSAMSWNGDSQIKTDWTWEKTKDMGLEAFHGMRIIDLDGDGKDEIIPGNFAINSDGTLKYKLDGVVHGDRFYIGKLDPNREGLQGFGIQQNNPSGLLEYYYDATKGEILWTHNTTPGNLIDVGRGLVGDIDPRFPGYEVWSFSGLHNGPTGTRVEPSDLAPYPTHIIWWDADETNEGLNGARVEKWNPLKPAHPAKMPRFLLLTDFGAALWDKFNPMFFGDILGDWRTEIIAINNEGSELLIFSTDILTDKRYYTMAHNPAYRNHMTIKGYLQSPLLDYYFGSQMTKPRKPNIYYALKK